MLIIALGKLIGHNPLIIFNIQSQLIVSLRGKTSHTFTGRQEVIKCFKCLIDHINLLLAQGIVVVIDLVASQFGVNDTARR